MKKNLIALCLAMASGSTLAWTTGDFNGSIDIGGTIEKDDYKGKWLWKSGIGFDNYENTTNELVSNGRKLIIKVTEDKPILLGKTSEAFSTVTPGLGAVPRITFNNYKGDEVQLSGTTNGAHHFDLPVRTKLADEEIGTLRVNVTAAGAVAREGDTAIDLSSLDATQSSEIFYGGLSSNAVLESAELAAEVTGTFGSLNRAGLVDQIKAVNNSLNNVNVGTTKSTETMVNADRKVVSAAYAMGMSTGQTLEATFNEAVNSEIEWRAPLNIVVSYQ